MELLESIFNHFRDFLALKVIGTGDNAVTLGSIISFTLAMAALYVGAEYFRKILSNRILIRFERLRDHRTAIGSVARYFTLIIGFFVIVQSFGLDLSSVYVLFGSLGVGIGIGLQNVAENLISGVIIFFERPLKVGDRVEVGDIVGQIQNIGPRATTVLTNDNISVIVPNSRFVSDTVINWSHNNRRVRLRIPVGVAYKENPETIRELLLQVADEHPDILKKPEPEVWFINYGESSLDFELVIWTETRTTVPKVLQSELYYSIFKIFKQHKVEIPFPQRDLHLVSVPEKMESLS
ncbi:mechanosensitive ion channel family protein [Fulvitalea axinellae]